MRSEMFLYICMFSQWCHGRRRNPSNTTMDVATHKNWIASPLLSFSHAAQEDPKWSRRGQIYWNQPLLIHRRSNDQLGAWHWKWSPFFSLCIKEKSRRCPAKKKAMRRLRQTNRVAYEFFLRLHVNFNGPHWLEWLVSRWELKNGAQWGRTRQPASTCVWYGSNDVPTREPLFIQNN